jgi:hypothetical protein
VGRAPSLVSNPKTKCMDDEGHELNIEGQNWTEHVKSASHQPEVVMLNDTRHGSEQWLRV